MKLFEMFDKDTIKEAKPRGVRIKTNLDAIQPGQWIDQQDNAKQKQANADDIHATLEALGLGRGFDYILRRGNDGKIVVHLPAKQDNAEQIRAVKDALRPFTGIAEGTTEKLAVGDKVYPSWESDGDYEPMEVIAVTPTQVYVKDDMGNKHPMLPGDLVRAEVNEAEAEPEQTGVTAEEVQAAWMEVFPNSSVAARKAFGGGTTFKFRLAKDQSEVASKIMDNDPLNYTALLDENGNWKEYSTYMFVAPEEGSYNVFGSVKFRKKSAKNVKIEAIKKRFAQVKEFVAANADNMIRLHFDINEKLGGVNEEHPRTAQMTRAMTPPANVKPSSKLDLSKKKKKKTESAPAQNPVAKHQRTFNKATVQRDKKKDAKRGKTKYRKDAFEGRLEDEGADFYDGQQVELKPAYADSPGEVFTLSQWDGRRGWIGDADGRGWGVSGDQIMPADVDDYDDDEESSVWEDNASTTAPDDMTRDPRITHVLNKARVSYPGAPDDLSALVNMMGDEQEEQDNEITDLDQYNGTQDIEIDREETVNVDQEDEITDLRKRIERLEGGRALEPEATTEEIVPNDGPDQDEYPYMDDETGEAFPAGMHSSVNFDDDDDDDDDYEAGWESDEEQRASEMSEADKARIYSMFGDVAGAGGDPIDYVINAMGVDIDDLDELAGEAGYADANEWAESFQEHEMESIIRNSKKLNRR